MCRDLCVRRLPSENKCCYHFLPASRGKTAFVQKALYHKTFTFYWKCKYVNIRYNLSPHHIMHCDDTATDTTLNCLLPHFGFRSAMHLNNLIKEWNFWRGNLFYLKLYPESFYRIYISTISSSAPVRAVNEGSSEVS